MLGRWGVMTPFSKDIHAYGNIPNEKIWNVNPLAGSTPGTALLSLMLPPARGQIMKRSSQKNVRDTLTQRIPEVASAPLGALVSDAAMEGACSFDSAQLSSLRYSLAIPRTTRAPCCLRHPGSLSYHRSRYERQHVSCAYRDVTTRESVSEFW
jgi:hypothetical protein